MSAYDPKRTNVDLTSQWCPRGEFSEERPIVWTANYCPSPRTIRAQYQAIPNLSVTLIKEVEMRNHVLVLTTSAVLLACGGAASAQAPSAQSPSVQQSPATQPTPGGPMMQQQDQTIRERLREQLQERAQRGGEEDSDQDSYHYRGGMMGGGMMGRGMMGRGYGYHDGDRGVMRSSMLGPPPMMMRMIFSLMDADGDGKLSLQEFQAAHERIFKAIDANKDGFVTLEEMQDFIRGTSRPASKQ
jgi:hypothetical protein